MESGFLQIFTRRRIAIYLAVLIAFSAGAVLIVQDNRAHAVELAAYRTQAAAYNAKRIANLTAYSRAFDVYENARSASSSVPTRDDAARLLNAGRPIGTGVDDEPFTEPTSGGKVVLQFRYGRWIGVSPVAILGPTFDYPNSDNHLIVGTIRRLAYVAAYVTSGCMLLILLIDWRHLRRIERLRKSVDPIFFSLLGGALAMIGPNSFRGWRLFFQDDSGAWGFVGAAGGLIAVFLAWRTRLPSDRPLCPACGYDLTGNESGVCPECGTPRHPPVARHSQAGNSAL